MITLYDDNMRTIIDVPDEMIDSLDQMRRPEKKSRAALIREAIAEYLEQNTRAPSERAFGLWRDQPGDSVEVQRRLRDEWDDR
jgi:predicted transcriptional regulator